MPSPFVYLYVFRTIPTSPDPGLTSRCGWTAKANPPPPPVTSQPPSFGRSPVSGRSLYTLFQGGLPTALLTIPLRDAVWPLTCMLAHKAVPHACRHLLFTYMCSPRYQLAQTPVSPHGAAGQQKQPPPPSPGALLHLAAADAHGAALVCSSGS